MKYFTIIVFLLSLISKISKGQELNTIRNLGKVNFSQNANFILSASEENGKFTYVLTDVLNPSTPIFKFALYSNTLDNFEANIEKKVAETKKVKEPSPEDLEKYFFYFVNQNSFMIENSPGEKALEMNFSDSMTIFGFKHTDFSAIKLKHVRELLNELFEIQIPGNKFKNSAYNFNFYDTLKANMDEEKKKVFGKSFEVSLEKINNSKPKSLRNAKLYKEIEHQYYKKLIYHIESKVRISEKNGDQNISGIQKIIDNLEVEIKTLNNDTIRIKNSIQETQLSLEESELKRLELIEEIQSKKLIIWIIPDEDTTLNSIQRAYFDTLFSKNSILISNLGNQVSVEDKHIEKESMDSTKLEELYTLNLDSIEKKVDYLDELDRLNFHINNLNRLITRYRGELINIKNELNIKNSKLDSMNLKIMDLRNSTLESIESELLKLKDSNKFHFKARNIQLEINSGYIENIIVVGEASIFIEPSFADYPLEIPFSPISLKFVNDYPIGISAKKDMERLGNIILHSRFQKETSYELRLFDLITNIEEILALDRTDYSPKDGSYQIDLLTEKKKEFQKSDKKEILQLKVFSDFIGLNDQKPNGLIQIEIDREIPLVTKRITRPYVWCPLRFLVNRNANIGTFNFFRPRFIFSKVEDNNRYLRLNSLPVTDVQNGDETGELRLGTSTLDIKQFERYSIGADLNLLLYNVPYGKSTFLLNAGMHFGRTDLVNYDTIPEVIKLPKNHTNSFQPSIEVLWRIMGDERFGFEVSYVLNWLISDQFNFIQRANTFNFEDFESLNISDKNKKIQRVTLLAYLNLDSSSAGRLFFRYRSNSEFFNFNNTFAQLQIGYTTYLTKKSP